MKKVKHSLAIESAPEETNFDDLRPILHIIFSVNLFIISINLITNNNCGGCVSFTIALHTELAQKSFKNCLLHYVYLV